MVNELTSVMLRLGWKFPYIRALSSRSPVILLYHGISINKEPGTISSDVFEQHILFLKQRFEIIHPEALETKRNVTDKIRVLLTFDDGYRNHAEVAAPILEKHRVPAIFFVSSRHSTTGKYLWFSYLRALQNHFPNRGFYFRGTFIDMASDQRSVSISHLSESLLDLQPHPSAMYEAIEHELPHLEDFMSHERIADCYAGMTAVHVAQLASGPLFIIGGHTEDHPLLTRCNPAEAYNQIEKNKTWIEQITTQPCNSIAYPSGDYNSQILEQCHNLGFFRGYAVAPRTKEKPDLEVSRIGLYTESLDVLGFKVQWGNLIRRLNINKG